MNLSRIAKNEISVCPTSAHCLQAMLSALVHTAGTITFDSEGMGIAIAAHGEVAAFALEAFDRFYNVSAELECGRVKVTGESVADILLDLGILGGGEELCIEEGISPRLIKDECCAAAYLKGGFLGCGSLSLPKSGYNLELCFNSRKMASNTLKLLERFNIKAAIMSRRGKAAVYIKVKEMISDFLAVIGASKAVIELNLLMVEREVARNSARLINCDIANVDKTISTSVAQRLAIASLNLDTIKSKALRETAEIRLKHPESSYEELAQILGISKSAVKYRLNKLVELAKGE